MAGLKLKLEQGRELLQRLLSGIVIVVCVIGGIYFGGAVWLCIALLLCLSSLAEYYRLLSKKMKLSRGIGYLCALALLTSSTEGVQPVFVILVLSVGVYLIFGIEMMRRQSTGQSYAVYNVGGTLSGVFFIAVPWTCIVLLRNFPTGTLILVTLFACTWGCDVMAYLTGRHWGRNKLCDQVSPNKTWEGLIGGAMGSILTNAAIIYFMQQPPYPLVLIGFICGLAGQIGDLAESLIKRELDEKDSGRLIPGHGGVLDRFDSILINGLLTYMIFGMML